jgi:protein-disulfide isomerase
MRALAILFSAAALVAQTRPAPDKAQLERTLRHIELWIPQVAVTIDDPKPSGVGSLLELPVHLKYQNVTKDLTYYVTPDYKHVIRGDVYGTSGNPFADDLKTLDLKGQPGFGPANAPLTLAVFSDFQCPLCRDEALELRKQVPAAFPNDLRVVYMDFPLDTIHPWARPAAIAGRCAFQQGEAAFWSYFDYVYENQKAVTPENLGDKVLEWAKANSSVDSLRLKRCIDTKATEAEVNRTVAEGQKLKVDSTPTAFLNGRRLVGAAKWENLQQILKLDLEYAKANVK